MNLKKTIGWLLAFTGVALFTGILVEDSNLKTVALAYGCTFLLVGFVFLVLWLIDSD